MTRTKPDARVVSHSVEPCMTNMFKVNLVKPFRHKKVRTFVVSLRKKNVWAFTGLWLSQPEVSILSLFGGTTLETLDSRHMDNFAAVGRRKNVTVRSMHNVGFLHNSVFENRPSPSIFVTVRCKPAKRMLFSQFVFAVQRWTDKIQFLCKWRAWISHLYWEHQWWR